jgi:hypothetical protein
MSTEVQVALPTATDVLSFLGWSPDSETESQASAHVEHVARAARGYTRGRGFVKDESNAWTCSEDIAAIVLSATARSLSNPTQDKRVEAGVYNAVPGSFASFSVVESIVLRRYRKTAA